MDETVLKKIASCVKEVHKHAASDGTADGKTFGANIIDEIMESVKEVKVYQTTERNTYAELREALIKQFIITFGKWYGSPR